MFIIFKRNSLLNAKICINSFKSTVYSVKNFLQVRL